MEKPDLTPFLDRLTSHTRLNEAEEQAILGLPTRVLEVDAKAGLVALGQTVDHVSVVARGMVARFGQNAGGGRQITALHIAGDAPDLHTVVLPSDTVPLEALTSTTILRVANANLRAVAARYPAVAEAFWRHCSIDAAITTTWVVNLGRRDAKTRIAHLLCEMAVRHRAEVTNGQVKIPFPLTQTQLGDAAGMTPVHVNRSLKSLVDDGFLTYSRQSVRIPDWARLMERAEFDGSYLKSAILPGERLRIVDQGAMTLPLTRSHSTV